MLQKLLILDIHAFENFEGVFKLDYGKLADIYLR